MPKAGVSGTVPGFWVRMHSETAMDGECIEQDGTGCDYASAIYGYSSFSTESSNRSLLS
jgi:hypothetical protein